MWTALGTIESHEADGDFVTVRKSLRPNRPTTPGIAKRRSAQAVPAAASALAKDRDRSPSTGEESAKRTAFGFGVGSGRTVRGMAPPSEGGAYSARGGRRKAPPRGAAAGRA